MICIPAHADDTAESERQPELHARVHLLSQLRHPRIIEVYDYGLDHGTPYYTMELLVGHELAPLTPRQVCSYLRDVASSLALLHARRMLHRDLSPRNVRRIADERCKLLDFGTVVRFGVPTIAPSTAPTCAYHSDINTRAELQKELPEYLNNPATALPDLTPLTLHVLGYCVFAVALLWCDRVTWAVSRPASEGEPSTPSLTIN